MPFRFRDRMVTKIAELLEFLDMDRKLLAQGSQRGRRGTAGGRLVSGSSFDPPELNPFPPLA